MRTWTPKNATRKILCPFGCDYSADAADYFWARAGHKFTCEHEEETFDCDLVERVYVEGTDHNGRKFGASGWATVKESATVDDLD